VQHRATKLVSGLEKLTYEERLDLICLTTLEERLLRRVMIEVFKILKRFYVSSSSTFFQNLTFCGLRWHSLKLCKNQYSSIIGKFSFFKRVLEHWNKLTEHVVSSGTVNTFKKRYDQCIKVLDGLCKSVFPLAIWITFSDGIALNHVKSGKIKRTFTITGKEVILHVYKSLVRPQLEYSIQAWTTHYYYYTICYTSSINRRQIHWKHF